MKRIIILIVLFAVLAPLKAQTGSFRIIRNNVRLPWTNIDCFVVDGQLYICGDGLLQTASVSADYIYAFQPDTLLQFLGTDVRYVVRNLCDSLYYYTVGDITPQLYVYSEERGFLSSKNKRISLEGWKDGVGHPTFSPDGNLMVFSAVSNGGFGEYDLWGSLWDGKQWGAPFNMGRYINSPGSEISPSFYKDYLIFSSDGFESGKGHFSLYAVKLPPQDENIDKIVFGNHLVQMLPEPINSDTGNLALVSNVSRGQGYWLSYRNGGRELFSYQGHLDGVNICGKVTDDTGLTISNAEVVVKHAGREIGSCHTDERGVYSVFVQSNVEYQLEIYKEKHYRYTCNIYAKRGDDNTLVYDLHHDVALKTFAMNRPFTYTNVFPSSADVDMTPEGLSELSSLVQFLRDNPNLTLTVSLLCDQTVDVEYNKMLCDRRLQSLVRYFESVLPPKSHVSYSNANLLVDTRPSASMTNFLTIVVSDLY